MTSSQWLRSRPISWQFAGFVCMVLFGAQLVFLAVAQASVFLGFIESGRLDSYWVIANGLLFHAVGILVVKIGLRRTGLSWRSAFGLRASNPVGQALMGVVCYLAALPLLVIVSVAYQVILVSLGIEITFQDVVSIILAPQPTHVFVLHMLLITAFAPVAEEILFRGILLPLLAKSLGTAPAILLSSLLFALVHLHVPAFFSLFVLAAALSIAYIHARNIAIPVIMHILFNAVNILLAMHIGC